MSVTHEFQLETLCAALARHFPTLAATLDPKVFDHQQCWHCPHSESIFLPSPAPSGPPVYRCHLLSDAEVRRRRQLLPSAFGAGEHTLPLRLITDGRPVCNRDDWLPLLLEEMEALLGLLRLLSYTPQQQSFAAAAFAQRDRSVLAILADYLEEKDQPDTELRAALQAKSASDAHPDPLQENFPE